MKNQTNLIITAILVVLVGAGAFFGGMKYQQSKQPAFFRQFNGQGGQGQRFGNGTTRAGFRPVSGEIISADNNSLTVKLADGSSKIVLLSDSTQINKAETAARADLTVGQKVAVFGQENSDGSVLAQNVQLNPQSVAIQPGGNPQSSPSAN